VYDPQIMQSNQSATTKKPGFSALKRITIGTAVFLTFVGLAFSYSKTAHAGLFSFLSDLVGNQEAAAGPVHELAADSQISPMIVLQAVSSQANAASTSDMPPIVGDTTLSPEVARMNATSTEDVNTQISIYVVRQGDTISSVAKMFNVSMNTILWANDLTSRSTLRQGQTLVILPVTGLTYTVKKGDSIQSIAKKYGSDIEDILNYNDITLGTTLAVGQEIIIPDAEVPVRTAPVSTPGKITKAPNEPLLDGWGWPSYPGYYSCPLPGARLTQGLHGHNGIDLGAPKGTPIRAAAAGTVIIARANGAWNGGYGNFIAVLHDNGTQSLYAHLSRGAVVSGQRVEKGQTVGYVGSTGLSTGNHLHLEIRGAQNPFADASLCR
jgi:murein DD-endopeptidase MepM/ murein hydrolase activator NlpD